MTTLKTTTPAVLVLAAGLVLTGCASTPEPVTPTDAPTEAPVETDAPVQTPAPEAVAPRTGDIFTVAPTDLGPSQRAFPLPDGTFVLVDRNEPLPAGVQEVLNAQAAVAVPYVAAGAELTQAEVDQPYLDATAFRAAATMTTGKNVIVVYRTVGGGGCNGSGPDPWTHTGASGVVGTCRAYPSMEAARDAAQASVDAREDAVRYVVVVPQG